MDSEASAIDALRQAAERTAASLKEGFNQRLDRLYTTVLASPGTILVLFIIVSAVFAQQGLAFQDQIDDDVEIFLPDGAESTDLLLEVRTEWSTDIAIIYITTPNANNPNDTTNITDEIVLNEISWLEGDDRNIGGDSTSRGIDFDKSDRGRNDGVLWVLSPAQVIKEINSADGRFNNSLCVHGVNNRLPVALDCDQLPEGGEYAIPSQDRIDQIVEGAPDLFANLSRDTNDMDPTVDSDNDGNFTNDMDGDGIWDTTAIVVGMHHACRPDDAVITSYRCHAHALIRGVSPKAVMAELTGRIDGISKGKGGSMHMFSKEKHFYGGHGIVAAQVPIGAAPAAAGA